MREITVTTEEEYLEAVKTAGKDEAKIIIHSKEETILYIKETPDNLVVEACGSSHVEAWGSSHVEAWGSSHVEAWGSSHVEARGSSHVEAWDSSHVEACGSSHVEAWGSSHVEAWGSSHVVAWDSSHVVARGSSHVVARGSSHVEACGSSHVEAWDSSHVVAWDSSHVEAYMYVTVSQQSNNTEIILGGNAVKQVVDAKSFKNVKDWLSWWGVKAEDKKVIMYKAVSEKYRDFHTGKIDYSVGNLVEAPDWLGKYDDECGHGLHVSPHKFLTHKYSNDPHIHLKVEVALEDIAFFPSSKPEMPDKIRVHRLKVIEKVEEG